MLTLHVEYFHISEQHSPFLSGSSLDPWTTQQNQTSCKQDSFFSLLQLLTSQEHDITRKLSQLSHCGIIVCLYIARNLTTVYKRIYCFDNNDSNIGIIQDLPYLPVLKGFAYHTVENTLIDKYLLYCICWTGNPFCVVVGKLHSWRWVGIPFETCEERIKESME